MSDDKKSDEKRTAPATPKAIPVREIKLVRPTDLPGKNMVTGLQSKPDKTRPHHTIEYQPWWRHFQVTHITPNKPALVGYVHESNVASWFPA